jgi:hypothetical protein
MAAGKRHPSARPDQFIVVSAVSAGPEVYSSEDQSAQKKDSMSITLRNAADIFSLACMVLPDFNLFDHEVFKGISHLKARMERRWRNPGHILSCFYESKPRTEEGNFYVDILCQKTGWAHGLSLADQKRTQSASLQANFTKKDASTYFTLANKVLDTNQQLPEFYSKALLADIRELMQLEMRMIHSTRNVEDSEDSQSEQPVPLHQSQQEPKVFCHTNLLSSPL